MNSTNTTESNDLKKDSLDAGKVVEKSRMDTALLGHFVEYYGLEKYNYDNNKTK